MQWYVISDESSTDMQNKAAPEPDTQEKDISEDPSRKWNMWNSALEQIYRIWVHIT